MFAVLNNHAALVGKLLSAGADRNKIDFSGKMSLNMATNDEMRALLLAE